VGTGPEQSRGTSARAACRANAPGDLIGRLGRRERIGAAPRWLRLASTTRASATVSTRPAVARSLGSGRP
jgi:hypothetical protein